MELYVKFGIIMDIADLGVDVDISIRKYVKIS